MQHTAQPFHPRVDRLRLLAERARRVVEASFYSIHLLHEEEVNDTLGHATGDRLLQDLAWRLAHSLRAGGYAYG